MGSTFLWRLRSLLCLFLNGALARLQILEKLGRSSCRGVNCLNIVLLGLEMGRKLSKELRRRFVGIGVSINRLRDELSQNELGDPMLLEEVRKALDELTGIMGLGSIYDFQL